MSLVEKALQKVQAASRARQDAASPPDAAIVAGRVVARDSAISMAEDRPWYGAYKPTRTIHVNRDSLRAAGLLPPEEQEREIADQYRTIKRPLIKAAFEPPTSGISNQLILMASALPEDGKTFTCINLAMSMSLEKDHNVLLVDGDVAKAHVSRLFGVDQEPGLLDVLADPQRDIESVILPTDVPRLCILPAGQRSEFASELLASARMRQVVERLAHLTHRGLVLMDSPPILLTSEARVLLSVAGQIVLVVKAGHTPQQAVQDTIEIIGRDKNIRLILNSADLDGALGYYYGYHYGYAQKTDAQVPGG